jgi:UDP-N-acetylmuramoylalanine--D-glutamate ligase
MIGTLALTAYHDKIVAVLGCGKSGLAAIKALVAGGATVIALDDDARTLSAARALGAHINSTWNNAVALIVSPGFPFDHPHLTKACTLNIPILSDFDLLYEAFPHATYIGITGTNGKSTTTALTGHILRTAGLNPIIAGNIGVAVLDIPDTTPIDSIFVLEASSFQLHLSNRIRFNHAAILNITPDHLDKHHTMQAYRAAKAKILRGVQHSVIGVDSDDTKLVLQDDSVLVSVHHPLPYGVYIQDGMLIDAMNTHPSTIMDVTSLPRLLGNHNWQNIAVSYALACLLKIDIPVIVHAIQSFQGLAHRQEPIRTLNGITFVNDSKATNSDATAKALACYPRIYWLVGGKPKTGGLQGLESLLHRIVHAFCYGEAMDDFADFLQQYCVPHTKTHTLDRSLDEAYRLAVYRSDKESVILLSPACASFDQFNNFEHRGDVFRALVASL